MKKIIRILVCMSAIVAFKTHAYVGAGLMEPIPPLTLEELGVSREDHELAKRWTEAHRGHYENEITRDEWIRDALLSRKILELGPQRWARAVMSLQATKPNPSLGFISPRFTRDPETSPVVIEFEEKLARHYLKWIEQAPHNHPAHGQLIAEITSLQQGGTESQLRLLDSIGAALKSKIHPADDQMSESDRIRSSQSFESTLAAFRKARSYAASLGANSTKPEERSRGSSMQAIRNYADSHWIIGQGVAFDLKPEEISRLKKEGRLYDPDDLPPPAPIDGRNWIVVSSLIIAAVLVGLFLGRQRLRRKFEQ